MSLLPTIRMINGSGKPRLILVKKNPIYTSTGVTTFTDTSVTEAEGAAVALTSSSVANPTKLTTGAAHGRAVGDWIRVAGHAGSTPDINGKWEVLAVPSATELNIGVNVTVGGAGGTIQQTPAFSERGLSVNMRVSVADLSTNKTTRYGKITAIDGVNNKLTVDAWVGGTPAGGEIFKIDGWVADLPECYDMTETFEPATLIHPLWEERTGIKFKGFRYVARLDYALYIAGDAIYLLRPHLNMQRDDSLILIPKADAPQFSYNVYFAEPFELAKFGDALGHRKPVFVFRSRELVPSFPIISGYGSNYANNYGVGL